MASLGHLEVELLASILEYVDDEHPQSTRSLALANKYIYNTSRLVSHRRQTLHFSELNEIDEIATRWMNNPIALRGIRHIIVSSTRAEGNEADIEDSEQWRSLVTFIEKAARLRTITWKCRLHVPLQVLTSLENFHPHLQLKVHNFTRPARQGNAQHPAELALAKSPLLVGINAKIYYDYTNYQHDLRELALRRIVSRAPNLRYVSVLVDQYDIAGHKAATLKQKEPFYVDCTPNSSIRTFTLDGYPMSKATLEDWSNFVNLSTLENIKCLRGGRPYDDYFPYALKVLPNIKHVSLNLRFNPSKQFRVAVENFLSLCPTLESISLWSWTGRVKLSTILNRHGGTLQTLQLHEREEGTLQHPPSTADNVKAIREACPHLRDLTIDMRRESRRLDMEERNNTICEELALFGPQLDKVQIYFDLGIASIWSGMCHRNIGEGDSSSEEDEEDSGEEMETFLDNFDNSDEEGETRVVPEVQSVRIIKPSKARHIERYVEEMWQRIFGERKTGARQLDAKFGEWEQKTGVGSGGPGQVRSLETGLKSFWTVRPCVRDDEQGECVVNRHTLF